MKKNGIKNGKAGNGEAEKAPVVSMGDLYARKLALEEHIAIVMVEVRAQLAADQEELARINITMDELAKRKLEQVRTVDVGTIRFDLDGVRVKTTIKKIVEWDQALLAKMEAQIRDYGDNPEDFIQVKRNILETSYKSWSQSRKDFFAPARAVKPGAPVFDYDV